MRKGAHLEQRPGETDGEIVFGKTTQGELVTSHRTPRLLLRRWRTSDRLPFAKMNADPAVMEHMPGLLDRAQSDELVERVEEHFLGHGFGLWAVQVLEGPAFIGFVGMRHTPFTAPFTPCVELAWRLARESWGNGYATEAALEVCRLAFSEWEMKELVSFTTRANLRSLRVMERLGMARDPAEDFEHPGLPEHHPLRPHVLYRLTRERWTARPLSAEGA